MTRRTGSPTPAPKAFPLVERDDPALHRYASAEAALWGVLPLLVRVVRQQQEAALEAEDGSGLPLQGVAGARVGMGQG